VTTVITKRLGYLATAERILSAVGPVEYCEDQQPATIRKHLADASIVLATKGCLIDADAMDEAPNLKIIAAPTAGFEWVDVEAATARGIPVIANTGAAADAVAEFALGSVLALTRRIVEADRDMHAGTNYADVRNRYSTKDVRIGSDLTASTVAVVGLGHIGMKTAEKLAVLRPAAILGYDPYASRPRAAELGIELCDTLADCLTRADVTLLHVPLTAETTHLINADTLALMKPGGYLVNCSRGKVVDEAALVAALQSGRLAAAALDVFEEEPLPVSSPLRGLDRVILTPHIAGVTAQSDETRAREISERVLACIGGTRPTGLANPAVWDSRRPFSNS
jgi:phosphoglycerate dehydrogenase-like enzyme